MKVEKSKNRLTNEYSEIEIVRQDYEDSENCENDDDIIDDDNVANYDDYEDYDDEDEPDEINNYKKLTKKLVEVTPPQNKRRYDIMKLINLYRKNECLWNVHTKNYKRIDLKNKAYNQIARQIGLTIDEMKRKIKNLRTAYLSAKKKSQSNYGTDDNHQPTLFYFKQMSFLDSCIMNRMPRVPNNEYHKILPSSSTDKPELLDVCKFEGDQIESGTDDDDDEEQQDDNHDNNNYETDDIEEQEVEEDETFKARYRKKRKLSNSSPIPQMSISKSSDINLEKLITNKTNPQNYNDEFDCFGQSIAVHLRKMPIDIGLDCMLEIQGYITKARLKTLEKN